MAYWSFIYFLIYIFFQYAALIGYFCGCLNLLHRPISGPEEEHRIRYPRDQGQARHQ